MDTEYSCHLFLISSASVWSLPFLSFIVPILAWNFPLISTILLKRSLVFPILLCVCVCVYVYYTLYYILYTILYYTIYYIYIVSSIKKVFLSLLAILWSSAFSWVYLSLSPLSLTFLLSSGIPKAPQDKHFPFLHFFFFRMVLVTASCTMSRTSVHSSSGSLPTRSNPLNLFDTSLYNHKVFDLGHSWMVQWCSLLSSI